MPDESLREFRDNMVAAVRDPDFSHEFWEIIRKEEHRLEMIRITREVDEWHTRNPWWKLWKL